MRTDRVNFLKQFGARSLMQKDPLLFGQYWAETELRFLHEKVCSNDK